jgi:hypothetical protein
VGRVRIAEEAKQIHESVEISARIKKKKNGVIEKSITAVPDVTGIILAELVGENLLHLLQGSEDSLAE